MTGAMIIKILLAVLTVAVLVVFRVIEKKRQARFREELTEKYGQGGES